MGTVVPQHCHLFEGGLGHIVVQPRSDLILIPPHPFNVVPHSLQGLLPGRFPGTGVWSQAEEMFELEEQQSKSVVSKHQDLVGQV